MFYDCHKVYQVIETFFLKSECKNSQEALRIYFLCANLVRKEVSKANFIKNLRLSFYDPKFASTFKDQKL